MIFARKKTPVFILGCQRSGTTICQEVFRRSRDTWVFNEGNQLAMTEGWRLRPLSDIDELIARSRKRVLIFKPLNDSQRAEEFLEHYPDSRTLWIFRDVLDTVQSAVRKWGPAQRRMMTYIGDALRHSDSLDAALARMNDWPSCAVYAERLSPATCDRIVRWTAQPISDAMGAAILWYARNSLFFDQGLEADPRAMPVRYESVVTDPENEIARMCDFIGLRYSRKLSQGVYSSSVGKGSQYEVDTTVLDACHELALAFERAEMMRRHAEPSVA
jgi:hypothetical protein